MTRRRVPLVATGIVLLAVAAMIGLGIWQLQRHAEKEAALRVYAANLDKPAIAFPPSGFGDDALFRRASAFCLQPVAWRTMVGRSISDKHGWRHIAECRTGAEGPGLLVDMGVSTDPNFKPDWKGGAVAGTITHEPGTRPLIAALFQPEPRKRLMLVSAQAAPGLEPSPRPSLGSVPNNHLAYAGQWFLFAVAAVAIYALALRRRLRGSR